MSADMKQLDPRLCKLAYEFLDHCHSAGLECRITQTWRSAADQNKAKAAGLSKAAAGQSPHNVVDADGLPCSRAFDFGMYIGGKYLTDGTNKAYGKAGEIAEKLGLEWGGTWHTPDYDHLQLPNWRDGAHGVI